MTSSNPMVPSVDWGREAQRFAEGQGRQAILCASCVLQLGMTTPPPEIVVLNGTSFCLDHLPRTP